MRYCVLYPQAENVQLVKDMGMMPYKLHKLFGYEGELACYKNGEYPYAEKEAKGLKLSFIKKAFGNYKLDAINYLRKNAREIDVLQVFSVTTNSMVYAFAYKFFNPKGKVYLKLDCSFKLVDRIKELNGLQFRLLDRYLNKTDLISVEQEVLYPQIMELLPKHRHKIIQLTNGLDFDYLENEELLYNYEEKENVIINVARLGAEEKNTEMLLEAFAAIPEVGTLGWKLLLIGSIEEDFKDYIENYFLKYPELKDVVIFKGPIVDRREIFNHYRKSKICALSSNFESFAFTLVEAAALGNVIVSTDVGIARELVLGDNGEIVPCGDCESLAKALEKTIKRRDLEECSKETYEVCREKYDWNRIIMLLNNRIHKLFSGK